MNRGGMMNKIPLVERDAVTGGLTNTCASLWCQFLSEELEWQGNGVLSKEYKRRSEELAWAPRGSFHDKQLEEVIKTWKR